MAAKPQPRRRANGSIAWRLPFRLDPGGPVTYETFDTPEDAEKFGRLVDAVGGRAARRARDASDRSSLTTPTLATWFETYLSELGASATPGTVADYRRTATRSWLPALGPLPVDAIEREAVVRWVAAQRKVETRNSSLARARAAALRAKDPDAPMPEPDYWSPKSIANAQRLLSSCLAAAVAAGHAEGNPARGVPLPSDAERAEMTTLSPNEFASLLAEIPVHYQPFVAFLAGTGARWGEVTALVGTDFDLDADVPVVRISRAWKKGASGVYLGAPKSRRAVRTVTLPASLVRTIRDLVEAAGEDLVFTSVEGKRIQSQHFAARVWRQAVERARLGKRPRVHDLRHTHASWQIAAGTPLPVIQRRLGHESITTTVDTYGHLSPDSHAGAADAADLALAGALPQIEA